VKEGLLEFAANRGNKGEMDWHDVVTGAFSAKFKMAGKIAVSLWNSSVDVSSDGGIENVFNGSKSNLNGVLDFGGEMFKIGNAKVGELGGVKDYKVIIGDGFIDQITTTNKQINK
jgi:hypothetical protein